MKPLIGIACIYAAAIAVAENTLGSAEFPLHFWYFDRIPAWQWSMPVHAAGFLWVLLWTRTLRTRPALLSTIVSWAFFIIAEALNCCCLKLFNYGSEPFGVGGSFMAVLALYGVLCGVMVYAVRRFVVNI